MRHRGVSLAACLPPSTDSAPRGTICRREREKKKKRKIITDSQAASDAPGRKFLKEQKRTIKESRTSAHQFLTSQRKRKRPAHLSPPASPAQRRAFCSTSGQLRAMEIASDKQSRLALLLLLLLPKSAVTRSLRFSFPESKLATQRAAYYSRQGSAVTGVNQRAVAGAAKRHLPLCDRVVGHRLT